jgi:hypothetical protein
MEHAYPYARTLSADQVRIVGIDVAPDAVVWLADELVAAGHSATAAALLEAGVRRPETVPLSSEDKDAILQVLTASRALTNAPDALVELRVKLMECAGGVLDVSGGVTSVSSEP